MPPNRIGIHIDELTDREREVLTLVGRGLCNDENCAMEPAEIKLHPVAVNGDDYGGGVGIRGVARIRRWVSTVLGSRGTRLSCDLTGCTSGSAGDRAA
jgi:hypothetical protein